MCAGREVKAEIVLPLDDLLTAAVGTGTSDRLALSGTRVTGRLHLREHPREDLSLLDGHSRTSTGLAGMYIRVGSRSRASAVVAQGLARYAELQRHSLGLAGDDEV